MYVIYMNVGISYVWLCHETKTFRSNRIQASHFRVVARTILSYLGSLPSCSFTVYMLIELMKTKPKICIFDLRLTIAFSPEVARALCSLTHVVYESFKKLLFFFFFFDEGISLISVLHNKIIYDTSVLNGVMP